MPSDIPPRSADQERRRVVWLLDDSPVQAAVGKSAIGPTYDTRVFADGASLLEALANVTPDLLVVDWHMPNLSGLDVCTFVRTQKDAGELPILVLTASGMPDDLVAALRAGANDFVVKPFAEGELTARLAALVRGQDLYRKLADAERRLRVEGEFREGFIGMLAHDLRQPLNTFQLANTLLLAASGLAAGNLLGMQRRAAERMGRMVHELLDFSRSRPETGMPVAKELTDFARLASELLDEIRTGHPTRTFSYAAEGDCVGWWDRDRLSQLCSNLVGNAIEHGLPDKPIGISLMRNDEVVTLSVENGGDRIDEEVARSMFDPFRRGKRVSKADGLGLGLHIVSEIARAHGGSVAVTSNEHATIFSVTLPVASTEPAPRL